MAFRNVLQPRLFDDADVTPTRVVVPVRPELVIPERSVDPPDWRPDEIPSLNGERRIILNAETNGLKWWAGDVPIGWSFWLPESGRHGYLPMRHAGGGNLPVHQVHAFLGDVRDMLVENTNLKFDLHMSRIDGVDLIEDTGNTFGDAAHYAALLDDNRMRFNLDQLSKDILGWDVNHPNSSEYGGLGPLPPGVKHEGEWYKLHSSEVKPYAVRNVEQVKRLIDVFAPQIVAENLEQVLLLEQETIPVVVEIEKNGIYLDTDLLYKWQREATERLEANLYRIYQLTGLMISSPDSSKDIAQLFRVRGIPITARTETGAPSFTDAVLKNIDDECIKALRTAGQLADLKSKYLDKYALAMRTTDGWLRHNLHQLRYGRDEGERFGTVSGRFSAAGDKTMKPDGLGTGGYNPQQVVAVEKQLERGWNPDYVVRKLFKMNFAADMMQVEYRLFADYAGVHEVYHQRPAFELDAKGKVIWIAGPLADFHAAAAKLFQKINPKMNRKLVKNANFATIYGAGLVKFAFMLGTISEAVYKELAELQQTDWGRQQVRKDPRLQEARETRASYNLMLPAVAPLLKKASQLAEQRGYVRDLIGRRARLVNRFHSSLNRIVQGGAASINKRVTVEVYKQRKQLGFLMQLTMHDELGGTLSGPLGPMKRVLNHQYFPLKVPILWDAKMGANWAACK